MSQDGQKSLNADTKSGNNGQKTNTFENREIKRQNNAPERQATIVENGMLLKGVVLDTPTVKKKIPTYKATQLPISSMSPDDFIVPTYQHRNNVAARVLKVVENEGPISAGLLTRRVVQSYSISRAGSRIQQFMDSLYSSMQLVSTIQGGDMFYWKSTQNPSTYREFRANGEDDNKRDARDIPIQEAANAVCSALEEHFSLPKDDLIRAAANHMGISRLGTTVSALFIAGIDLANNAGRIIQADNGNWMLKEES